MDLRSLVKRTSSTDELAVAQIMRINDVTARFGLVLSADDARDLVQHHDKSLRGHGRVEFGHGTVTRIIEAFCDSPYLMQSNYTEILADLIEGFYYAKNETFDQLSDDELIEWMKSRFNGRCGGSIELLLGRELDDLVRSIRFSDDSTEDWTDDEWNGDDE